MRITKLYIKKYKNIVRQEFDFSKSSERYIALIGLNGSGKSNLLEAISQIICKLLSIPSIQNVDGYRLEYTIDGTNYVYGNINSQFENEEIPEPDLKPSELIACYSGEDDRLWRMAFESYHSFYLGNAIRQNYHIPKNLYIDKHCWKIALISLLCASENEANVNTFLKSCLRIDDISTVTISFFYDNNKLKTSKNHDALKWFSRIINEDNNEINAKTLSTMDISSSSLLLQRQKKSKILFQYLYILSQSKRNKSNKVEKLITDISLKINDIYFDDLSEGEKKMILITCITQILGDENSLVLLDEPDAHVHIARKKELLTAIESFESQAILTTHSPIFVNEIYKRNKNNLFFLENGSLSNPDYINKLIQLSSGEIDFLNGSILLSSKKILVTEGPYDKRYIEKAIAVLQAEDSRYKEFSHIVIIPSGGAGENSKTFYEQVLQPQIDKYDKIVFLFDYDSDGYIGWEKIRDLQTAKLTSIFYQDNYDPEKTEKPEQKDTIMLEDLFPEESYKTIIDTIHECKTHKDFRNIRLKFEDKDKDENKKNNNKKNNNKNQTLADRIKHHIQNNYNDFKKEWFEGFKPVLDKLLEVFDLG